VSNFSACEATCRLISKRANTIFVHFDLGYDLPVGRLQPEIKSARPGKERNDG
jgi:hypothetical protein